MDITSINNNIVNQSLDNAKKEVKNNEFERMLKKAYDEKDEKQLKKVCREFEQIFLNHMYKQMRATIPKSDLVEGGFARETFEEMLDEKIAEEVAKGPGIGLGDMLYQNLARNMKPTYTPAGGKEDGNMLL